jgi:uncharacterized protein (DUF1330 family)
MPKGYWIGRVDVINPEGYRAYGVALREVLRKYGAKFLVLGGTFEAVEGKARARNIVLEFKDHATALACYRSPEYTKAKALRAGAVDIDIIVIEGYDGPQPTD